MAAATTAMLALLESGDEVVLSSAVYGGVYHFATDVLPRYGIVPRVVPVAQLADPSTLFTERTRLLWFESPSNPHLRCVDIAHVAAFCRSRGVLSAIDNTFASPVNQRPFEMGVDLVMQSATKYLNGHSDVTAGVVTGGEALVHTVEQLIETQINSDPRRGEEEDFPLDTIRLSEHLNAVLEIERQGFSAPSPRFSHALQPGRGH